MNPLEPTYSTALRHSDKLPWIYSLVGREYAAREPTPDAHDRHALANVHPRSPLLHLCPGDPAGSSSAIRIVTGVRYDELGVDYCNLAGFGVRIVFSRNLSSASRPGASGSVAQGKSPGPSGVGGRRGFRGDRLPAAAVVSGVRLRLRPTPVSIVLQAFPRLGQVGTATG